MSESTQDLIQEFLEKGGEIEKLDTIEPEQKNVVGSTVKKVPNIMTLAEAELMFGRKQKSTKKAKKPDYSNINMDLIPDHLKKLLKVDETETTKENSVETDQDSRSTKTSN